MWTYQKKRLEKHFEETFPYSAWPLLALALVLLLLSAGWLLWCLFAPPVHYSSKPYTPVFKWMSLKPSKSHNHRIPFSDVVKEVCRKPKIHLPKYEGVISFLNLLANPDEELCYSWLSFGGELDVAPQTTEVDPPTEPTTGDEYDTRVVNVVYCNKQTIRKREICFNAEYRMYENPCLVYSFSDESQNNFEKAMDLFNCEVHSFQTYPNFKSEYTKRSRFWHQRDWHLARQGIGDQKGRSLAEILAALGHEGREIKYVASNVQSTVLLLLQQVVAYRHLHDIQQISVGLELPTNNLTASARAEKYRQFYEAFEGLSCIGYKFVRVQPLVEQSIDPLFVPELNGTSHGGFQVTFIKDHKLF